MHQQSTVAGGDGVIKISDYAVSSVQTQPTPAHAEIFFNLDGTILTSVPPVPPIDPLEWIDPKSATIGNGYEIRATVQSGENPEGDSLGLWLGLTTNRSWFNDIVGGLIITNLLVEIRQLGFTAVLGSGVITLSAESLP